MSEWNYDDQDAYVPPELGPFQLSPEEHLDFLLNEEDTSLWFTEESGQVFAHFRHDKLKWNQILEVAKSRYIGRQRLEEFVGAFCQPDANSVSDEVVMRALEWKSRWLKMSDLQAIDDSTNEWAIPQFLPYGAVILAGPPKVAKSTMAFNIAVAKCRGDSFLGFDAGDPGAVLFLSLEDREKTLKRRAAQLGAFDDVQMEMNLTLVHDAPKVGDELVTYLTLWMRSVMKPSLVILDVFASVSEERRSSQNAYQTDYDTITKLGQWGLKNDVCVLILHHTNKAGYSDPFDKMLGTSGLRGATMANFVLLPDGDDDEDVREAVMYTECKIGPKRKLKLTFDYPFWTVEHQPMNLSPERLEIFELLCESPTTMKPKDIATELGKNRGSVRITLRRMAQKNQIRDVGGAYTVFDHDRSSFYSLEKTCNRSNNNNKINSKPCYTPPVTEVKQTSNRNDSVTPPVTPLLHPPSSPLMYGSKGVTKTVTGNYKRVEENQACESCGGIIVHDDKGAVCVSCGGRI